MDDKKQLFEKQLNYITSNFETDLQRLIKTRSYISISENVINEEIESLKKLSDEFEAKLKNLVMQTLDLERELSTGSSNLSSRDENFKSLKSNLNDYISLTESFISNLETRGKDSTGRLESLRSYYLMELEASRDELDSRINSLQSSFSDILEGKSVDVENYHEQVTRRHGDIDKKSTDGGFQSAENTGAVSTNPTGNSGVGEESRNMQEPYDSTASQLIDKAEIEKGISRKLKGGLVIFALLLVSLFLFIFLTGDKGGQKLAEDSYRQSKTVNKEIGVVPGESEAGQAFSTSPGSKPENNTENDFSKQKSEAQDKTNTTPQAAGSKSIENNTNTTIFYSVEGPGAYVREGPGTGYDVVTTVVKDNRFEWLGESDGQWMKIKAAGGKVGWISSKLVKKDDPPQRKISEGSSGLTLNTPAANLRTGPGTGYEVITVVKKGETFEDTGKTSRHWKKVKLENGTEGWISGKLITKISP